MTTLWFVLIAVLWTGYFVLEGFDFGVGILLPLLGRDDRERRVLINTIGPVWDGNEVWVITAGGATFAAFPEWYASLFSGFYLPLLLILLALIGRGVAFEYRGKRDEVTWRRRWDAVLFAGSLVPAALWGVVFANIVHGVPLDARHVLTGGPLALLHPYALLGGATTLFLFTLHGAVFLALKTTGHLRERARRVVTGLGAVTAVLAVGFLAATGSVRHTPAALALAGLAVLTLAGGLLATRAGRDGWAFAGTAATVLFAVAALFTGLYPDVLPSTLGAANSLTVHNAAAGPYTLKIMTWVAVGFTPVVLAYQSWTYWVFRRRVRLDDIPAAPPAPVSSGR
ncbi:MAG TPA: cytochrome d ubiquinol oxidase subunit II [Rugosimonospora sp.]|nr:cytochrome d ubiquinol oxidase subunit II [Rugosimonospora sp.]